MRLSSKTWYTISLLCLAGALGFWWLGNQRPPRPDRAPDPASGSTNLPVCTNRLPGNVGDAPGRTLSPVAPAVPLLSALASSNAFSNAFVSPAPVQPVPGPRASGHPYRLSNTPEPVAQLLRRDTAILLQHAVLDTARPVALDIPATLRGQGDPGSYLVQSRGPLTDQFRAYLKAAGAEMVAYIPNNAYLVRMSGTGANKLAGLGLTQAVLPWEPYYKLDAALLQAVVEALACCLPVRW